MQGTNIFQGTGGGANSNIFGQGRSNNIFGTPGQQNQGGGMGNNFGGNQPSNNIFNSGGMAGNAGNPNMLNSNIGGGINNFQNNGMGNFI